MSTAPAAAPRVSKIRKTADGLIEVLWEGRTAYELLPDKLVGEYLIFLLVR